MGRAVKLYRDRYGFITREQSDALGLAAHVRQGDVYVSATTKVEALDVLASRNMRSRPADLTVAMGLSAQALIAADLHTPGRRVFVSASLGRRDTPVVEVMGDGSLVEVGMWRQHPARRAELVFEPHSALSRDPKRRARG